MKSVTLPRAAGGFCIGACLLVHGVASAASRCDVVVEGDVADAWQRAAERLRTDLASVGGDCERIVVAVQGDSAAVTYEARDGRQAVRTVSTPDDLVSTVDALRVTGPLGPAAVQPSTPPATTPAVVARASAPAAAPVSDRNSMRFALDAGVRGGDERLFSPTLDGFAGVALEPWEIGIRGSWEMGYRQIGDELHRGALGTGIAAGVMAGRRQKLGPTEGFAGITVMLASIDQEARERAGVGENAAHSEARAGAYLGAALPARARLRARACLGAEFVPLRWGNTVRDYRGAPVLPWWAVSLMVGVEMATR